MSFLLAATCIKKKQPAFRCAYDGKTRNTCLTIFSFFVYKWQHFNVHFPMFHGSYPSFCPHVLVTLRPCMVPGSVGSHWRHTTFTQAVTAIAPLITFVTRLHNFTATSAQTCHPVAKNFNRLRQARAKRKPAARVDIKCSLVDDDVFWHNLMQFLDDELTENIVWLYSTNHRVDIGR